MLGTNDPLFTLIAEIDTEDSHNFGLPGKERMIIGLVTAQITNTTGKNCFSMNSAKADDCFTGCGDETTLYQ